MASGVGNENLVRFLEQQQQLNERLAEQQATLLRASSAAVTDHKSKIIHASPLPPIRDAFQYARIHSPHTEALGHKKKEKTKK